MSQGFNTLPIPPQELRQWWPFVERGLNAVWQKTKPHPDWLPIDVYASLKANAAALVISTANEEPIGFVVYYFNTTPFSNRRELFIWQAWTLPLRERGGLDVNGAVAATMQWLDHVARLEKCIGAKCLSARPAMGLWLEQFGFIQDHVAYSKQY